MPQLLRDIPAQATVMVDANILVYALFPQARQHLACKHFLERGARDDLQLHLVANVAADVIHRAMILEALSQGVAQKSADAIAYLKHHPQAVRQLTRYKTILGDLTAARINILPLTYRDLHASKRYRDTHGLLVNDSLILAVMQRERIHCLATNDPDFARVPHIAMYQPE